MNNLNIDLLYSENSIQIGQKGNYDRIPMKRLRTTFDLSACSMIYDMHIEALILQQEEKQQGKLLDANYSKVNINDMVKELEIPKDTKSIQRWTRKTRHRINRHTTKTRSKTVCRHVL